MNDKFIIKRLEALGFKNEYIDEFINIYKTAVSKHIPNPLYYTFVKTKEFDKIQTNLLV